jgi:hypothetical protein
MAGGIAHAYYKEIPNDIVNKTMLILDSSLRDIIRKSDKKYTTKYINK